MSDSRGAAWKLERQLLEANTVGSVLERLVDCAGNLDAAVDVITIALADSQHEIRGLLAERRRLAVAADQLVFVDTVHALAPSLSSARDPYFGAYARADHQLLFPGHAGLAAVGLAPLVRQNRLIGSLNLASHSPLGLETIKATRALSRLAVMAALAIDNALGAARLVRSGFVDVLTGWHNQRYLDRRLQDELARSERDQRALACTLIDVDDFRLLNARYGNRAGDAVLLEVSQRIETIMRRSDVAARYGSEGFVLLLPNTEQHLGKPLIERIQRAIAARPIELAAAQEVPVTVSVGVAEHRPGGNPADLKLAGSELLARAQLALYESQARRSRETPGSGLE
jgi:diguanylate cyclase (GGDEF)-like protein